nr:uncharacterized protein A4U43_C06F5130 [Ipomoea batatas]
MAFVFLRGREINTTARRQVRQHGFLVTATLHVFGEEIRTLLRGSLVGQTKNAVILHVQNFPGDQLPALLRICSFLRQPNECGMGPVIWFLLASKTVAFLSFPISQGRQPDKELLRNRTSRRRNGACEVVGVDMDNDQVLELFDIVLQGQRVSAVAKVLVMPFGSWIIVLLNLWITLSILRSSDVSNGIPKLGAEPGGGLNPIMISNAALLFSPDAHSVVKYPAKRAGFSRRVSAETLMKGQLARNFFPSFSSLVRPCTAKRAQPASSNILA